jgi:predicted  nucleic acid-binding Zn-ribbon protein
MNAILRCCASCQWIFKLTEKTVQTGCPRCGFGHYSARYVFGHRAYRYEKTQKPWLQGEIRKLKDVIRESNREITKRNYRSFSHILR